MTIEPALAAYEAEGYAYLGRIGDPATMAALGARIDDIMMGAVSYEGLFFQLDTTSGLYEDVEYGKGWQGPSRNYRKVEKLELDPLFRSWIELPLFERVARAVYGSEVSLYRALVFNKAAETGGTYLPWHQDGGAFWGVDRAPRLQIWTALDDTPEDAGCVEVFPGSHLAGLASPIGGVVPKAQLEARRPEQHSVLLPANAGDVYLIHNHVWHRSGRNLTGRPRRAFTACYLDGRARCMRKKRTPREFPRLFTRPP